MKRKYRANALLFALLAALLVTTAAGAAPKNGAVVSLSVAQGEFDSSQDVLVTVDMSNPTNHTVKILKWYTPVEGVEESLFAVMLNGEPAAYTGAIYKRPPATGQDYIQLKAGDRITSVVNLGQYYDLSQSGEYEIFYAAAAYNLYDPKVNNFKYREVLVSEKINVKIEARAKPIKPTPTPTPPPGGTTFNACTDKQQTQLNQARGQNIINMTMWINNPNETSPWFHIRALHPHSLDVMRYFSGDVAKVQSFFKRGPRADGPNGTRVCWSNVQVNLLFKNGIIGHLTGSYDAGGSYAWKPWKWWVRTLVLSCGMPASTWNSIHATIARSRRTPTWEG